ncbi:hypothetical protein C4G84_RS14050 [Vibrio parahaemolyticus O5:K30]|nr:hypothetical protein [Vibrio parahaemolyticus]EJG0764942.1 hypothetical protein [Vibrio parahaemolyticus O5:K30]
MTQFTANELIEAIKRATTLSELKQMIGVTESVHNQSSETPTPNRIESSICKFEDLELVTDKKMQKALRDLQIEDDEDITAMMIIVSDSNTIEERNGGCILIDKDGSTSYYLPEREGYDQIQRASLKECFDLLSDNPEKALEFFTPKLSLDGI